MRPITFLLVMGLTGASLLAQKSPKESAQVLVGVHLQVSANNASQSCSYRLTYTTNPTIPINNPLWDAWITVPQDPNAAPVQSPNIVEAITPGRIYYILFSCASVNYADFQFNPPPGYTVNVAPTATGAFIPTTTISTPNYQGGLCQLYILPFYVLPSDGAAWLAAGYSKAPHVSDVTWAISLGTLSCGASAGSLRWESPTVRQALLDSSALNLSSQAAALAATNSIYTGTISGTGWYTPQSIPDEIATYYDNSGRLRYIGTNQIQIYITETPNAGYSNGGVSGSYTIQIYPVWIPFQWVGGNPNSGWNFNGSCTSQYTISDPYYQGSAYSWGGWVQIAKYDSATQQTQTWTLNYNQSTGATTLTETDASLRTIKWQSISGSGTRTELETVSSSSAVAYQTLRSYQTFPWYEELVTEVVDPVSIPSGFTGVSGDPNGLALTTTYTYYNTTLGDGHYSKLKSVTRADGSWVLYDYFDDFPHWGELATISSPWQDAPAAYTGATSTNCRVVTYSYAPQVYNGYLVSPSSTPRTSIFQSLGAGTQTTINGTLCGQTVIASSMSLSPSYSTYLFGNEPMRTDTVQSYFGAGNYQTTVRTVFHDTADPVYRGKLYSQLNPDGTKTSASYWKGDFVGGTTWLYMQATYNACYLTPDANSSNWIETYLTGTSTQQDPSAVRFTTDGITNGQSIDPVWMTPYRSYRRHLVRDQNGNPQYDLTYVFTGGTSFQLISWKVTAYTWDGLLAASNDSSGSYASFSYYEGKLYGQDNPDGTAISNSYDALVRLQQSTKNGASASGSYPSQPSITTTYSYDAADDVTGTTVQAVGGPSLSTTAVYNLAGLVTSRTDERLLTTGFSYANGGSTVTTTNPNGSTVTTTKHLDGSPSSVTGNGQVNQFTSAALNSDGTITTTTHLGSSDSPRLSSIQADWLGRTIVQTQPAPGGGTFTKQSFYNTSGQLVKTTQTGMAATLYEYDGLGELQYYGLAVEGGATLDLQGVPNGPSDRVTEVRTQVVNQNGAWWKQTVTSVFNSDNNPNPVVSSTVLTKYVPWDFNTADSNSEVDTYDFYGNHTVEANLANSSAKLVTRTVTRPDSSVPEVTISYNGLLMSSQTAQNILTTYQYDALDRQVGVTDPRKGQSTTTFFTASNGGGVGSMGQVASQTDAAGNTTSFTYDTTDGRLSSQTDPLGDTVYHAYDHVGREIRTWGTGTFPVECAFDAYGSQVAMRTFRSTSINFNGTSWPLSDDGSDPQNPNPSSWTNGDTTAWTFDAGSGLLSSKVDAMGKSVSYTYYPSGKLNRRTWARGVVTTYSYDANTGEQTGISYSDGTPSVSYKYDRLGHGGQVIQTFSGFTLTTGLAYNVPGKMTQEAFDPGYFAGRQVNYQFDTTNSGTLGRVIGYELGTSSNQSLDQNISFGFDSYGRFHSEGLSGGPTFIYAYTSNSNLLNSITDTADNWSQSRGWEAHRDLLTSMQTSVGSTTEGSFTYIYDQLGRRSSRVQTGAIYARYPASGLVDAYSYDSKSEVTGDQVYQCTNPNSPTNPMIGRDFQYNYDPIGNRITSSVDSQQVTYSSNALNQITSRTVPGYYPVSGLSPSGSTVTVNGTTVPSTQIQGDYYLQNVSANNGSAPLWLSASASSNYGGSVSTNAFLPQSPESYAYDLDGNILSDGRWNYSWDAENRLLAMETYGHQSGQSTAVWTSGVPQVHIDFVYDYQGRRIDKKVSNWSGSAWVVSNETRFAYENWNVVADYAVSGSTLTLAHGYIWGMDISGRRHGAGGVGGLLAMMTASGSIELPIYDANGNVQGLTDRATAQLTANYEYSPFGETLRATGPYAQVNPFRFSSRYTDDETHLVYYGHRYYNSQLGRFLGRDPVEEKGGLHLYAFCRNNSVNAWDYLGLDGSNDWTAKYLQSQGIDPNANKVAALVAQNYFISSWYQSTYGRYNSGCGAANGVLGPEFAADAIAAGNGEAESQSMSFGVSTSNYYTSQNNPNASNGNSQTNTPQADNSTVTAGPWISPDTGATVGSSQTTWYSDGSSTTVTMGPISDLGTVDAPNGGLPAGVMVDANGNIVPPNNSYSSTIMCHGMTGAGQTGAVTQFAGLSAIPGSGPNAQMGYSTLETLSANATPLVISGGVAAGDLCFTLLQSPATPRFVFQGLTLFTNSGDVGATLLEGPMIEDVPAMTFEITTQETVAPGSTLPPPPPAGPTPPWQGYPFVDPPPFTGK